MIEFNTTDEKLPEIKIDGELFEIRPVGAGLILDIEELQGKVSAENDGDNSEQLAAMRQMFDAIEGLLIPKGKITAKEVVRRMPVNKLGDFVKVLVEL